MQYAGEPMAPTDSPSGQPPARGGRNAALVAAGILLSRLAGLIKQRLIAHVLGNDLASGVWVAATRIPNLLQNLLGEGVLSASLIPVYAGLRAQKREAEARAVAGAVFGLLCLVVALTVAAGVLTAPLLVDLVVPGFTGSTRELAVRLVRIIFPGTGVLVLSAWCLGVLNSHGRFFLSYVAPVVWNGVIIAAVLLARGQTQEEIVRWASWGFVVGSGAQFLVQLPTVWKVLGGFSPRPSWSLPGVRQVVSGFLPVVAARGVVQVSAWVDTAYASLLSAGAVSSLSYAQTISLLPISLFGMAISAAELPDMSVDAVKSVDERAVALRARLEAGLARLAFFVVPSAVAFGLLGDLVAGVLLETGRFTAADSRLTWYLLIGSAVALSAQTSGRLYASAFYALKAPRTPLKLAAVRVGLGIGLGYYAVQVLPGQLGLPTHLGVVFITVTTGFTAWLEMLLLRRGLKVHLGELPGQGGQLARVWGAAVSAGVLTLGLKVWLASVFGAREVAEWGGSVLAPPQLPVLVTSLGLLAVFCALYGLGSMLLGVAQAGAVARRFLRRR